MFDSKIWVPGGSGQLGTELSKLLPDAIFTNSKEIDISQSYYVKTFVKENNIGTIINCAAYTNVDQAEDDVVRAAAVNQDGPANLSVTGCKLIHISTDYVFDGLEKFPYATDHEIHPCNAYGLTKAAGEKFVLGIPEVSAVIRTAWLYSPYGKNFLKTMLKLGAEKESINVVNDQIGTPTYAADLAKAIVQILPQMKPENKGIYHFVNDGSCSWYDFATEIMKQAGLPCKVNPIPSSEYPTKARRPKYSVLDNYKIKYIFGVNTPDWKNGLTRCLQEINKQR